MRNLTSLTASRRQTCRERGGALLVVLIFLFILTGASVSLISMMNQMQTRAGIRYRQAAATLLAEAGVHRTLERLETSGSEDSVEAGAGEVPERIRVGDLEGTVAVSVSRDTDGAFLVTSEGEVAGVARRLKARVYLASPALLTGLYASGLIYLQPPPARISIVPYSPGAADRAWVHIAAGRELWFARTDVSINQPFDPLNLDVGPLPLPFERDTRATSPSSRLRIMVADSAGLSIGRRRAAVGIQELRAIGMLTEGELLRRGALPPLPSIDRAYYQGRAAANLANAALNAAAGKFVGSISLTG